MWSGRWKLCNLGWDTADSVITQRAKEILQQLDGFNSADTLVDIRGPGRRSGSFALLTFKDASDGEKWARAVGDLQKIFPENEVAARQSRGYNGDGTVFLAKEPTRTQRKPGRMTNRCYDEIIKLESKVAANAQVRVRKDQPAKQIFINDQLAALSCYGSWKWTDVGSNYLTLRHASKEALTAFIEESW